jgi:hypothetical protein
LEIALSSRPEIENGSDERRVRGMVRMKVRSFYLRLWIGRSVFIVDTREGFKRTRKNRGTFKALLGVSGE